MKYIFTLTFYLFTAAGIAQDNIALKYSERNLKCNHDDYSFKAEIAQPCYNFGKDNTLFNSEDSIAIGSDSVKSNILDHQFKFELSSLLSNLIVIGGEYRIRNRFSIEHWAGAITDFKDEYTKKSGFVIRSGVKWYLLKNYNPDRPLEGFYVKGELSYTKVSVKILEGYNNFIFQSPVYSKKENLLRNYAVHFFAGYQAVIGKHLTMDLCAGLGTSLQSGQDDLYFRAEDDIPGTYALADKNKLSLAFSISLGRAF